jgi:type II secretory pathway component PulF
VKRFGTGDPPKFYERVLFGRVSSGQLAAFCRQFAAYQSAGVDIVKSLASLQGQFARTALGPVIGRMLQGVRRGDSLTETVEREPKAFDKLFVSMIKVAEARGGVPETLRMMGRHYESRQNLIRQARSAMIYPIIVLICAGGVTALLTIWLLPMFASLLKDISKGGELPLPSQVLMGFSNFVQHSGWLVLPVVIIGTPILLLQLYKTEGGKRVMDQLALRIPVFGPLLRKLDTARFARALSSLLNAGVDVGSSLALTSEVMRLEPFRRAVEDTRLQVIHGEALSVALDNTRRFNTDVIAIVDSGEETGKIPESLDHLADDYEEQVAYTVRNLGQLVQPLLMIMMGGLVLFIILAVFLPYISMLTSLAKP